MQNENMYLKKQNHSKELEINTIYNLINRLNNEKDELIEVLEQKFINHKNFNDKFDKTDIIDNFYCVEYYI